MLCWSDFSVIPQGGKILYRVLLFSDGPVAAMLYQTLLGIIRLEPGDPPGSHECNPPPTPCPVSSAVLMVGTVNLQPTFL